ncbi:hypothetical protein HPG69_007593 [Diceros bicornis minor]|uniref:Anoctamin n=1 Tax=Diceros bicornis minor TaxID=77932 RepID=A0A7J7ED69_DICBM|nr:hypothetical protein HPG69_007593 [Diceros bicornis minor]
MENGRPEEERRGRPEGQQFVAQVAGLQGEESLQIPRGTEGDSFPLMEINACETETSEQWDFVLVAELCTQRNPRQIHRQQRFLEELRGKGFRYKVLEDKEKMFFGIRADSRLFNLYRTLLLEPEGPAPSVEPAGLAPIPATTRIRIVNFILKSKMAASDTFEELVKDGVFETRFPLHTREEDLKKKWAQWRNMFHKQPIDDIRDYFGEKVALYFAWLGWYTYMLVPAAVVGLLVFLSGFSQLDTSQISKEICEAHDIFMCPRGDHGRRYHQLSDTCAFAKVCHPWGPLQTQLALQLTHFFDNDRTVLFAIFMALWATVFLELWKRYRARVVLHWDLYGWDEDQEEMALELINCPDYQLRPYQHSYLRSTVILVLSLLMICFMIGMAHVLVVYRVLAAALFSNLPFLGEQVTTAVVVTGALVHYLTILIMTKVNKRVALKLCDFEQPRTFWERERKFTVKFFTLQFFVHFSSLIYIAFILGRWLTHKCRSRQGHLSRDPDLEAWQRNYRLNQVNIFSLFDEFMEMMIQYGFTTIFVAAFPLAPLLALLSNLMEIRLDAIKMVQLQRRLVPRKAKDIGQGRTGGGVGQGGAGRSSQCWGGKGRWDHGSPLKSSLCLTGYVNHSLSVFYTKDFQDPDGIEGSENVTECRYRDYRNAQDYNFSEQFWVLLAIRLAFLILFEHVALCIKLIAARLVPDVPQSVKNKVLEEKYQRLREKLRTGTGVFSCGHNARKPEHQPVS